MSRESRKGAMVLTTRLQGCPDLVYPEHRTACGDRGEATAFIGDFLVGVHGTDDPGFDGEDRGSSDIALRR